MGTRKLDLVLAPFFRHHIELDTVGGLWKPLIKTAVAVPSFHLAKPVLPIEHLS